MRRHGVIDVDGDRRAGKRLELDDRDGLVGGAVKIRALVPLPGVRVDGVAVHVHVKLPGPIAHAGRLQFCVGLAHSLKNTLLDALRVGDVERVKHIGLAARYRLGARGGRTMGVGSRHQNVFSRATDLVHDALHQLGIRILGEHAQIGAQEDGLGFPVIQHDCPGIDMIMDCFVAKWQCILRRSDVYFGGADK